jgi:hypothetical protein
MRNQMAAFIARARAGSDAKVPASGTVPGRGAYNCVSGGTSLFTDVAPTDQFCKQIHYVVAHGMSYGCTDAPTFATTFCPAQNITRRSMAVMLARDLAGGDASVPAKGSNPKTGRSYDCSDGSANAFPDVPDGDSTCRHIYYIWSNGIIDGNTDGTYGPDDAVVRAQMAKFLTNAYALSLP